GTRHLWRPNLRRSDRRGRFNPHYRIGSAAGGDAPADPREIRGDDHRLGGATSAGDLGNRTPGMGGDVTPDGPTPAPAKVGNERGPAFSLPRGGHARLVCGAR